MLHPPHRSIPTKAQLVNRRAIKRKGKQVVWASAEETTAPKQPTLLRVIGHCVAGSSASAGPETEGSFVSCMYVCMHACMYVYMVCMNICIYTHDVVYTCICLYIHTYIHAYVDVCIYIYSK